MPIEEFGNLLIDWYLKNKRNLPWRNTRNPYLIWLSEIILQQTRVNQGLPYYLKFSEQYPTVRDLANATEQEVLALWAGLGYYSRARNMHFTAKEVIRKHGDLFPSTYNELIDLKGIGPYTASAVSSFSAKEKRAAVDGNAYRVLSRYFGLFDDIGTPQGQRKFRDLANELLFHHAPDLFNQAIMEFGALHCTPSKPLCFSCVLSPHCYAFDNQKQDLLPVKQKKTTKKDRFFYYLVLLNGNKIMMKKRTGKDIWKGMYDFLLIEKNKRIPDTEILHLVDELTKENIRFQVVSVSEEQKHLLTHQNLFIKIFILKILFIDLSFKLNYNLNEYNLEEAALLPMPVVISRLISYISTNQNNQTPWQE